MSQQSMVTHNHQAINVSSQSVNYRSLLKISKQSMIAHNQQAINVNTHSTNIQVSL
jgi:hypothetical protein